MCVCVYVKNLLRSLINPDIQNYIEMCPEKANLKPLWRCTPSTQLANSGGPGSPHIKTLLNITSQPKSCKDIKHLKRECTKNKKKNLTTNYFIYSNYHIHTIKVFIMIHELKGN